MVGRDKEPLWELRIAGVREGGSLYASWNTATTALLKRARYILGTARREKAPNLAQLEIDVNQLGEEILRAGRAVPRKNIIFASSGFHFAVNRVQR